MSLFGSSPEDNTGTNAKGITSQFSLFDGDGNGSGGPAHQDSGMPHSKRTAPHDLLKTLLPREDAPGAYTEAYDAVVQSEDRAEKGGVTADEVRKMLATTGLPSEEQDRIHRMLFANDQQAGQVLGRNEFNVFLALTALAQEGEDPTFDTIDERQNTLPTPKIGYIDDLQSSHDSHSDRPQTAETDESTISQRQPRHSATFAFPDHDPWASPDVPRAAPELLNGASERATSSAMPHSLTFPTAGRKPSYDSMNNGRGSIDNLGSRSSFGNGTWVDPFPANSAGFMDDTAATFGGGFENLGQDRTQTSTNNLSRTLGGGKIPAPKEDEIISITMLPEKEGIFMFQHRNYEVKSHRRNTSVIRRFSDFAWLHDCLTKRYPFRQIPLLPPKRVGVNGTHLAADSSSFLDKRRRGLVRFANALVQHPVLSQEQLVVMFLTVPTELAVWRKQATISVHEEFTGKVLPPDLEDSLPRALDETFDTVRSGIKRSAEIYIQLCTLFERLAKRFEGIGAEQYRIARSFQNLTDSIHDTYAADTNDVPSLNLGINASARYLMASQGLFEDESQAWNEGVLEDLKKQRDRLVSMRDMFDRRDRYAKDNIPQLEKRIATNEKKLSELRARPEGTVRPGEIERVEESIMRDKESIVQQHERGVLIRECIRDELLYFQASQYQISRLHQDWSQERVKYAELQADNWRAMADELEGMPSRD